MPDEVFRQPTEAIATFLRHLWATDGCLRPGGEQALSHVIRYDTTSEALARRRRVAAAAARDHGASAGRLDGDRKGGPSHRIDVTGQIGRPGVSCSYVGAVGRASEA